MDIPVLVSILAGMSGLIIAVPFAKALSPFRANHVSGDVSIHFIMHSYLWMLIGYKQLNVSMQHLIGFTIAGLLLALVAGFLHFRSRVTLQLPHAELVFLFTLAAFPVLAYLLAYFVTHFLEARYIQPAMIGIAALLAILMAPLLQNKVIGRVVLALLFVAIAGAGVLRIQSAKEQTGEMMASLVLSPETQRNLDAVADQPIYVMNPTVFFLVGYYSPNAEIRSHITLAYSRRGDSKSDVEADINGQMENMRAADVRNIVRYKSVAGKGTEHLFLLYHNPWDWTDQSLADAHAEIRPLGDYFGGDLVSVRFP